MMKDVFKIDEQGFYDDLVKIDTETNTFYSDTFEWRDIDFDYVEVVPPVMYRPKWNGSEWEEGATPEEIQTWQETNRPPESQPTEREQIIAEVVDMLPASVLAAGIEEKYQSAVAEIETI